MIVAINLVGNSLILTVVRKSKHFSRVTRHLIGHVAVADITFGCSLIIHASFSFGDAMSFRSCLGIATVGIISSLCSCCVCLIFVDNYLSVRRQSPAQPGLSLQKARLCVIGGWVFSATFTLVFYLLDAPKNMSTTECRFGSPAFTDTSLLATGIFVLIVSVVTMFFMFATLYTIKKKTNNLFQEGSYAQNVQRERNLKMRSRIVRLFVIIAVGFIISWCPVAIGLCVTVLCTNRCSITVDHLDILGSFMTLNAVMNIIVYIIKDNKFRSDLMTVIKCGCLIKCQVNQVAPQNNIVAMGTTPPAATANPAIM